MDVMKKMTKGTDITLKEILNNMLDAQENLELKTHVMRPKDLTNLEMYSSYYKGNELTKEAGEILDAWIEVFRKNMVSYKRLSRTEVVQALSKVLDQEEENQLDK